MCRKWCKWVQSQNKAVKKYLHSFFCARLIRIEQQASNELRPRKSSHQQQLFIVSKWPRKCVQAGAQRTGDGFVIGLLPARHDWWLIFVTLLGLWMSGRLEKKSPVKYNLRLKHKEREVTPGYTFPSPKGKQRQKSLTRNTAEMHGGR